MNNVNMGGMNAMGGPVGGAIPMMNNGGVRQPMQDSQRSQLNTYIYEYFLRNGMYDCARSLLHSEQPINVIKDGPERHRDDNGNIMGNGADENDGDSKDDVDSKRPNDLPAPNLPKECPESCFLYEWWCLFWDMFNAQRGKGDGRAVMQYVAHTQAQSRARQESQQNVLRTINGQQNMAGQFQMMRSGMNDALARKAIQNSTTRNVTPQQMQIMQHQHQQKQQQMSRDPSDGNQQRPQSPGSAENAPSPSKRPRLDGAPFNPQGMVANGRQQSQGLPAQQVGDTGPSNAIQAAHMSLTNGIESNNLTAQQFQNFQGAANPQAKTITAYQQGLSAQQQKQMPAQGQGMPNPGGPQNQGSPNMMQQSQDPGAISGYYNAGELGSNGMRGGPAQGGAGGSGNHALQDYQMQLMLLEQQNKKRLMMARQEQDSMGGQPRPDGPGGIGPNGQPSFQGTSPQGARSVNSPNPSEQMKRGIPSPLPEGQSRGSPSGMNFNMPGGQMDPNMGPQQAFFKMNGMENGMVGSMSNGMRPPSSHPSGVFNGQMTQQQMAMARQQQQQAASAGWQNGPNGAQMMPNAQGAPQQPMGTPQQRQMPPPSAPATGATANGRTQPSSPQQGAAPPTPQQANKANPKKKNDPKDKQTKRAPKKGTNANLTAGATPSADLTQEAATPTPATPITPVHPKSFAGQNGTGQPVTNGQPPTNNGATSQQSDPLQSGFGMDDASLFAFQPLEFANPSNGNMDVIQDFDFDSFLHQDGGDGVGADFNFESTFLDNPEIVES